MTKIAVINANCGVTDEEIQKWMQAVATQVANEFFDAWAIAGVDMRFIAAGDKPTADEWWMTCLPTSDVADALGYHDLTPTGTPLGKVFVETTIKDEMSASVCFDHEMLELLIDPYIQLAAQAKDGRLYSYEVCDAVEDDKCGYLGVNGVLLSDFVTPAWFCDTVPMFGAKFSFNAQVRGPFALAPGGYISVFNNGTWSQINADLNPRARNRAKVGSRRERRAAGRNVWRLSTKVF